ncbi:hypothetical protein HZH66_014688 [Vespula vulgaris]|uniref:Uncharacterized protein n=1 Tax=Vespula vulgaris TaxID=7454 RepID=A0A834J280_VESVU|nr:hypothetical protein HZH66_014688 [Vespula vulgaris]
MNQSKQKRFLQYAVMQCGLFHMVVNKKEQQYSRQNGEESSSNSPEVLQRSKIDQYLICNYFQRREISATLDMVIKHSTSEVKHVNCETSCSSVHQTICPIWIIRMSDHQPE